MTHSVVRFCKLKHDFERKLFCLKETCKIMDLLPQTKVYILFCFGRVITDLSPKEKKLMTHKMGVDSLQTRYLGCLLFLFYFLNYTINIKLAYWSQ